MQFFFFNIKPIDCIRTNATKWKQKNGVKKITVMVGVGLRLVFSYCDIFYPYLVRESLNTFKPNSKEYYKIVKSMKVVLRGWGK